MTGDTSSADRSLERDERGQSLNDFVIGVALFLLVLGFTFAFLPTIFQPFVEEGPSSTQRADRTADHLVGDLLAENESRSGTPAAAIPGLLNATCTEAYFDGASPEPPGCRFATADVHVTTALPPRTRVNVTVRHNGSIVGLGTTQLARGENPERDSGVARAVRIATLGDQDVTVIVRVW